LRSSASKSEKFYNIKKQLFQIILGFNISFFAFFGYKVDVRSDKML